MGFGVEDYSKLRKRNSFVVLFDIELDLTLAQVAQSEWSYRSIFLASTETR